MDSSYFLLYFNNIVYCLLFFLRYAADEAANEKKIIRNALKPNDAVFRSGTLCLQYYYNIISYEANGHFVYVNIAYLKGI